MDKEFETWCDQWQQALDKGIFPENKPKLDDLEDYFGSAAKPSGKKSFQDADQQYWNDVHQITSLYGNDPEVLSEHLKRKLTEEVDVDMKSYTREVGMSPNPVKPTSVGMDQDITNPISTGATYSVADLENLETLKVKLHDLLVKLNSVEVQSQSGSTKLESQIQNLQKQIDELSDSLGRTGIPSQIGD